jgi:hypothetical protein
VRLGHHVAALGALAVGRHIDVIFAGELAARDVADDADMIRRRAVLGIEGQAKPFARIDGADRLIQGEIGGIPLRVCGLLASAATARILPCTADIASLKASSAASSWISLRICHARSSRSIGTEGSRAIRSSMLMTAVVSDCGGMGDTAPMTFSAGRFIVALLVFLGVADGFGEVGDGGKAGVAVAADPAVLTFQIGAVLAIRAKAGEDRFVVGWEVVLPKLVHLVFPRRAGPRPLLMGGL